MKIKNSRYFTRQTIEIQKSGLKIEKKWLFEATEYEISFEQIDNKKKIQITMNSGLLITGVFFFIFGFLFQIGPNDELTVIFSVIAFTFAVIALITRKKVVTIASYSGNNIELYFTKSNKEEVVGFANEIIEAANAYFLNRYSKIDKALPVEPQLNNLQFLRDREIITEEHFETLKNQLLGRENKSSIGFTH